MGFANRFAFYSQFMITNILTIVFGIFIVGLLIFLHELGHFILAKREKMMVEEFGFGYPPRIFGKKVGQTLYSLNWIPFGGFVKIFGEQGDEGEIGPDSFYSKPWWSRVRVVIGGVVMFWLIAIVVLIFSHAIGIPTAISDEETKFPDAWVQLTYISKNSPAQEAGLKAGDIIGKLKIKNPAPNGPASPAKRGERGSPNKVGWQISKITKVNQLQELTKEYAGQEITLEIKRGEEILNFSLAPRKEPPKGQGAMGVSLSRVAFVKYSWFESIWRGITQTFTFTWFYITALFKALFGLLTGGGAEGIEPAGPVGIAFFTVQAFRLGINYFLNFLFSISVALAVCNILPIPALDGGKLLFLCIEKIKGSPVKHKTENLITGVLFIVLIMFMIFVTVRFDIPRFF